MKRSFAEDPEFSPRLFDLLDIVFPGIRGTAEQARSLGASWESVSTPYVREEGGKIVSHVGVIGLDLVLMGNVARAGSIHAVATHPDHRRRGHYRRLMEEVLEDCAGRYDTLILTTEEPDLYEPFGFRVIQEHGFTVTCDSPGGRDGLRLLDTRIADDVTLLFRLLETREPVSEVASLIHDSVVFCFNESRNPLHYAEDLDAIFVMKRVGTRLDLFNIVGQEVPSLAALLERIPEPIDQVAVAFSPDRLGVDARAAPWTFDHDGPSYLMARGPFAAEGTPFTLPRSGRT